MVLTLASLALTCLTSADVVPQEPKTILSSSEVKSLNKKAKKWYDHWMKWDGAEGDRRSKAARARRKSQDAFRKEWDRKSESKGDLLASVPDILQVFKNCFPYSRVSGLSGTLKRVKGGDGPSYYHRVPKSYKPDIPIRTIVMIPGFLEDRGVWMPAKDLYAATWEGSTILDETAFMFPDFDNDLDLDPAPDLEQGGEAVEIQRISTVLIPAGYFQKQFNMDREAFYLDCGRGSSAFGLRMAANFPSRFAGLILRSPVNDENMRLGSLTGLPILLIRSDATREDCDALKQRFDDLQGGRCTVIDGEGEYPYLASQAEIVEWLTSADNPTRRNLFRERVVIEPVMDRYKKAYWVQIGTAEPLTSVAPGDRPFIEAVADRKSNRITITTTSIADFTLLLNDELIDLGKEFTVVVNGTAYTEQRDRSFRRMTEDIFLRYDPGMIFSVRYSASVPKQ